MSAKQLALGLLALVCIVIAVVVAVRSMDDQPLDESIAAIKETFTCSKCGATMELTIAEQTEMLRKKDGRIYCKSCGQEGPQKRVLVKVSGSDLLQSDEPASSHNDEEDSVGSRGSTSKEPPQAAGVRTPTKRNR